MKWNDERFWGFIDTIAVCMSHEEKKEMASEKLKRMSAEEQAEIIGLFEEHIDELSTESIYQAFTSGNNGPLSRESEFREYLAGIISNGHDFYKEVLEHPDCLVEVYPHKSELQQKGLLQLFGVGSMFP